MREWQPVVTFCPGKLLRIHLILQHCPGASDGILLPGHTFHTDIAASACVHWLLRDTPNAGSPGQDKVSAILATPPAQATVSNYLEKLDQKVLDMLPVFCVNIYDV